MEKKQLTQDEAKELYRLVDTGNFGACYQDLYLKLMKELLSYRFRDHPCIPNPSIVHGIGYRYKNNYRSIVDKESTTDDITKEKIVHAYFENPLALSPLLLAVRNPRLIYQVIDSASILGAKADSTTLGKAPFTMAVDMLDFKDIWENKRKTIEDRLVGTDAKYPVVNSLKLKYTSNFIIDEKDLFDVIKLPLSLKK